VRLSRLRADRGTGIDADHPAPTNQIPVLLIH
jgi:hypothetical protein